MRAPSGPAVYVNVTAAREGVREAISVSGVPSDLNPLEALKLADDLERAAAFVDELCPPLALNSGRLKRRRIRPFVEEVGYATS